MAIPLLTCEGDEAALHQEGLDLIQNLPGFIYPVVVLGSEGAGKSFLASWLLGESRAFYGSDVDADTVSVLAVPMRRVASMGGQQFKSEEPAHMLLLDCGSGAFSLPVVQMLSLIIGAETLFVAQRSCHEGALETLAESLCELARVQLEEGAWLPERRLIFAVNKTTARLHENTLEESLMAEQTTSRGVAVREAILAGFADRQFVDIPLLGGGDFQGRIDVLREMLIADYQPHEQMGSLTDARRVVLLLELVVKQMAERDMVSLPALNRNWFFHDEFLTPVCDRLWEAAQSKMPQGTEYIQDFEELDPREDILELFGKVTEKVQGQPLTAEARVALGEKMDAAWRRAAEINRQRGAVVLETTIESRDIVGEPLSIPLGGSGFLAKVMLTQRTVTCEHRQVHMLRTGQRQYEKWSPSGVLKHLIKEKAFQSLDRLPRLQGKLMKRSPRRVSMLIGAGYQERMVGVRDGHLFWWTENKENNQEEKVSGVVNFLLNKAMVANDASDENSFVIKPRGSAGWQEGSGFSGGQHRNLFFSAKGSAASRDEWVLAIQSNIYFADEAYEQLGHNRVMEYIGNEVPLIRDVLGVEDVVHMEY